MEQSQDTNEIESDVKKQFEVQNVKTFWDKIKFWFFIRRVHKNRLIQLWECNLDLLYFRENFSKEIGYNDTEDRKLMSKLRESSEQADAVQVQEIEERIAHSKAIKQTVRETTQLRRDTLVYLAMLELWMHS